MSNPATETEEKAQKTADGAPQTGGKAKKPWWKRALSAAKWVIGGPVALVGACAALLYAPPVQKWATDKACEVLSEKMDMDVSVGSVHLGFPLNLELGDVVAVEKTEPKDTLINAKELDLRVKPGPLLKKKVEVEELKLKDAKLNTKGMIESIAIKGEVGELKANARDIDLNTGVANVDHISLKDSKLHLALADSVPEDTTESEPTLRRLNLEDIRVENSSVDLLLSPQADSVKFALDLADASLKADLDLEKGDINLKDIELKREKSLSPTPSNSEGSTPKEKNSTKNKADSSASTKEDKGKQKQENKGKLKGNNIRVDLAKGKAADGFDVSHIALSDVEAKVPTLTYKSSGDLDVKVDELSGTERSGLQLQHSEGEVLMTDSGEVLHVKDFKMKTPNSDLAVDYKMDMNAFDEPTADNTPGEMALEVKGTVGKDDLAKVAPQYKDMLTKQMPQGDLKVDAKLHGNPQQMYVDHLNADMPGVMSVSANSEIFSTKNGGTGTRTKVKVDGGDLGFVKNFVPADARNSFNIPKNLNADAEIAMADGRIDASGTVKTAKGAAKFDAAYGTNDDSYDIDLTTQGLNVNQFVPLDEQLNVSGHIRAKGKGFDIYSPKTYSDAEADLTAGNYGKICLDNSHVKGNLKNGHLDANLKVDNKQVSGMTLASANLKRGQVDAHADASISHADLQAMGFADDRLESSLNGVIDLKSDFGKNYDIAADIDRFDLYMGDQELHTDHFDLTAQTHKDTTDVVLNTGDMAVDLHSPENLFDVIAKGKNVGELAMKGLQDHTLDPNLLKQRLPRTTLHAKSGSDNIVAKYLAQNGISYSNLNADFTTTPETGLLGEAHVEDLQKDSLRFDQVDFDMHQDSTQFVFNAAVKAPDQDAFSAFSANLDGYIATTDADLHLIYKNKYDQTGIDLGLHALVGDTLLQTTLYPKEPILAFKKFEINKDNYVNLGRKNRVFADVALKSKEDDCEIYITANPADTLLQDIRAVVKKLNLDELQTVLPGMPDMGGLVDLDANYRQTPERFWVNGMADVDKFAYEGTEMGDVSAVFDYEPAGNDLHRFNVTLGHEGENVAFASGTYNSSGEGSIDADVKLTDLPLSLTRPFIGDDLMRFDGHIDGDLTVKGPLSQLDVNGQLLPDSMTVVSDLYGVSLRMADDPIAIHNSRITFDQYKMYNANNDYLTLNGWFDFADFDAMEMRLSLYGKNFKLVDAPKTHKSLIYGSMYGDFFARVNGTLDDLKVRGLVKVLKTTDMTYVMADTPLSIDDRLSDIVTFVDFTQPPSPDAQIEKRSFTGMDMSLSLMVEEGAKLNADISADKQSYVKTTGSGNIVMNMTPEGVFTMQGRYTMSDGEMKYSLPVIPLKTFSIEPGSYVEFTGEPGNPTISFAATEETRATVTDASGSSRSVRFETGLEVSGTLENMELNFTIEAPEDLSVKNELASMPKADKNKLAVGLLCTGLYLSSTNSSGISANNALNNFLQSEINNIAGKALSTAVNVDVGVEQSTRDDGTTRTDYSFRFSKRFFSDRLNVIIGGRVNADGNRQSNESGAYIDNVSLEWRLNSSGTRYTRIYHEKNYDNLIEGELIENGASIVLRRKMENLSELLIWKKED